MKLNPNTILPSTEVLEQCRIGLTKHIKKTRALLNASHDYDSRKELHEKIYRLQVIKKEIKFLLDVI